MPFPRGRKWQSYTMAVCNRIRANNYRLIVKRECVFRTELKGDVMMRDYIDNHSLTRDPPLNPRDAFYGGRTENYVKFYETKNDEKIKYVDVTSLYPYICKAGKFPLRHPVLYIGESECRDFAGQNYENFSTKVEGIVYCKILPPRNLFHPVLPIKMHGKLLFGLCRTCCEEMSKIDCIHKNEDLRCFKGTWVSLELKKALEMGYVIKTVYEIWQYQMTQYDSVSKNGDLFAEYIDTFYKLKTKASGLPEEFATIAEYVEYIKEQEGIELDGSRFEKNPSFRVVEKTCLNSLWGFFGQQENKTQTRIVDNPSDLHALLTSPMTEVSGIVPVNDNILYVSTRFKEDTFIPLNTANVIVAAFVTAQARLKLYSYLEKLGESTIYCDTDSAN